MLQGNNITMVTHFVITNSPHNDQTNANMITASLQKNIVTCTADSDSNILETINEHTSGNKQ